jgi:hypothetical protein
MNEALRILAAFTISIFLVGPVHAQLWSGILDPTRAADWTMTGVTGGIPTNRSQCGATIEAYTGTAATINNALAACGQNQYVQLAPGTFNLSTGINFTPAFAGTAISNVTLRGAGPELTNLVFSSNSGSNCGTLICISDSSQVFGACTVGAGHGGDPNMASWTAGYTAGTTQITLSSIAGNAAQRNQLAPGMTIYLDQLNEDVSNATAYRPFTTEAAPYALFVGNMSRPGREMAEGHKVLSVSGTTVTIYPPIAYSLFSGSQSPQAWWCGSQAQTPVFDGIENLTITNQTGLTTMRGLINFTGARDSWVKNVRQIQGSLAQVWIENSVNVEVRDSYFFKGLDSADTNYGLTPVYSSFVKIENNILHHQNVALITQPCFVCVIAYNFIVGTNSPNGQPSTGMYSGHAGSVHQILWEGNEDTAYQNDHASAHGNSAGLNVLFRNRITGFEPIYPGSGLTQSNMLVIRAQGWQRFNSYIGNVLGTSGTHTIYELSTAAIPSNGANWAQSIYCIGYNINCTADTANYDMITLTSTYRWFNYDTSTSTTRCLTSEVPFGQAVPSSCAAPPSLYLSTKPSWFGSQPWPAIGPDVTGQGAPAGHTGVIPAKRCFLSVMGGPPDGSGSAVNFNAENCYGSGGGAPPQPPTGLIVK